MELIIPAQLETLRDSLPLPERPFLVMAGNCGSGKSTMAELLSRLFGVPAYQEPFQDNPYLQDAIREPHRWRYASAKWFLEQAIEQHRQIGEQGGIHDRGIVEHCQVFARAHFQEGWLIQSQLEELQGMLQEAQNTLPAPHLLVYLHTTPTLALERIRTRGRDFEAGYTEEFLTPLHLLLEEMVEQWEGARLTLSPFPMQDYPHALEQVLRALAESAGKRELPLF